MSNYPNITISDFQNICRTCLSRGDLKPLYEKCFWTRCLAETLMFCTGAKISKDDGLPANICTNCISEVNRRFSFAKLCETSDIILRKCLAETLTQSQEVEEKVLEIKQEMPRTVKEVLVDYKYVETQIKHEFDHPSCRPGQEAEVEKRKIEIKQEDVKIGLKLIMEEVVKDFEYMKSEQECLKTETEFENNLTPSQKVEFINQPEEEVKIKILHELISPKCPRTVEEVIEDYKNEEGRQIKKEFECCKYVDLDENAQIKHEFDNPSFSCNPEEEEKKEQDWKNSLKPIVEEVEKVFEYNMDIEQEEDTRIEQDYNNPGSRSKVVQLEDKQTEHEYDNPGFRPKRRCTNAQIELKTLMDEDSDAFVDPEIYEDSDEDFVADGFADEDSGDEDSVDEDFAVEDLVYEGHSEKRTSGDKVSPDSKKEKDKEPCNDPVSHEEKDDDKDKHENSKKTTSCDTHSLNSNSKVHKPRKEQDWKIAFKPTVKEVEKVFEYMDIEQEEDTRIEQDYNNPGSRSKVVQVEDKQTEHEYDNPGFRPKRRCTNAQIELKTLMDEDSDAFVDPEIYEDSDEDFVADGFADEDSGDADFADEDLAYEGHSEKRTSRDKVSLDSKKEKDKEPCNDPVSHEEKDDDKDKHENSKKTTSCDTHSLNSNSKVHKPRKEQDWKIAFKPTVEEVEKVFEYMDIEQEEDTRIEQDYNNPGSRSKVVQVEDKQTEHEYGNPGFRPKRRCTNSQIELKILKDEDSDAFVDPEIYEDSDEDFVADGFADEDSVDADFADEDLAYEGHSEKRTSRDKVSLDSKVHKPIKRNKPNKCSICRKAFQDKCALKVHMRVHTGERPYVCDVCGRTFGQGTNLTAHKRIHTGEKPYVCSICNTAYRYPINLKSHMRSHTGERPYTCKVCNKSFKTSNTLSGHERIHSGEKPHLCSFCSKDCITRTVLKIHMRTHTGEKPYVCSVCSNAYGDPRNLKHHMKKHTGEKPYKCKVCSKAFIRPNTLKYHMGTHSKEKPYACKVCSKTFARSENLKEHMKNHSEEKPYKCEICSKSFVKRVGFELHMRRHTGEKPFKCDDCSKSFAAKSTLTVHMIVHTGVKSHVCTICSKRFTQISSLKRHMSLHTGKKP